MSGVAEKEKIGSSRQGYIKAPISLHGGVDDAKAEPRAMVGPGGEGDASLGTQDTARLPLLPRSVCKAFMTLSFRTC